MNRPPKPDWNKRPLIPPPAPKFNREKADTKSSIGMSKYNVLYFSVFIIHRTFNMGKRHGLFAERIQLQIGLYLWIWFALSSVLFADHFNVKLYSMRELALGGRLLYVAVVSLLGYTLFLLIQKQILPERKISKIVKDYKTVSFPKWLTIVLYIAIHIVNVGGPVLVLSLLKK